MQKVLDFLKENPVFYFATEDGDRPRVRPLGFFMEYEGKLYFAIGKHKKSYQQILVNPNVEICTASPNFEWIRISGKAVTDDRPEAAEAVFAAMPRLRELYNEKTGWVIGPIYLEQAQAEFLDFSGKYEKVIF
ncbi:MAG: pyridoxamine 5'-phosphate oxidase family protein [Deltaproteobacteria bacterium]